MGDEHDTCEHQWRHIITVQKAEYQSDKTLARAYWVCILGCQKCGAHREEPQAEMPEQMRRWLG